MNKPIKSENCSIDYDSIKYFPIEDFRLLQEKKLILLTLIRINLNSLSILTIMKLTLILKIIKIF